MATVERNQIRRELLRGCEEHKDRAGQTMEGSNIVHDVESDGWSEDNLLLESSNAFSKMSDAFSGDFGDY